MTCFEDYSKSRLWNEHASQTLLTKQLLKKKILALQLKLVVYYLLVGSKPFRLCGILFGIWWPTCSKVLAIKTWFWFQNKNTDLEGLMVEDEQLPAMCEFIGIPSYLTIPYHPQAMNEWATNRNSKMAPAPHLLPGQLAQWAVLHENRDQNL